MTAVLITILPERIQLHIQHMMEMEILLQTAQKLQLMQNHSKDLQAAPHLHLRHQEQALPAVRQNYLRLFILQGQVQNIIIPDASICVRVRFR